MVVSGKINNLISQEKIYLILDPNKLHLDNQNPRLPEDEIGRKEEEILDTLLLKFELDIIYESIIANGYFSEEPLILAPINLPSKFKNVNQTNKKLWEEYTKHLNKEKTSFTVVEGNRRLAAIKLILNKSLRKKYNLDDWEEPSEAIKESLKKIPVIIYSDREKVVPYLGVRHIAGIKKWDPYAKARYVAYMHNKGRSLQEIRRIVGDKKTVEIEKLYLSYLLVGIVEEELEVTAQNAKNENFSYISVMLNQSSIKNYIGLPKTWKEINFKTPISKAKIKNLVILFSLLFGEEEGKNAVISDHREIQKMMAPVFEDKHAISILISTRNINLAYQSIQDEELNIIKLLRDANRYLSIALSMIPNNKTKKIKENVRKCKNTLDSILKVVGN